MIYFLHGADSFRSRQKLNEIVEGYKKVHKSGLNLIWFDAAGADFRDFSGNFKIASMFDEKKLIVMKNVFSEAASAGRQDKFQEDFMQNIKKTEEAKDIVIVYEKEAIDPKNKLFKALNKEAKCQEFNFLAPAALAKWASQEFEKNKIKINPDARALLLSFVGNNLWQLSNEINKLSNYKKGGVVKREDVEMLIKPNIENDIFKTIDALAAKDKKRALDFLHKHLDAGDNPLRLLSMFAYQFRNLLAIRELIDQKQSYAAIAVKSGLKPFVARKSYYLCSQFSFSDLKKIYLKIFQIDSDIKTGKIDSETALDMLIAEV